MLSATTTPSIAGLKKSFTKWRPSRLARTLRQEGADTRYWKANPNERLRGDFAAIEQEEEDRRNNTYRFDRLININMMIVNDHVDSKITLPKDYAYSDAKPSDVVEPKTIFGDPVEMQEGETPRKAFARWLVSKRIRDLLEPLQIVYGSELLGSA